MKAFRAFFLKAPEKQTLADTEKLPKGSQCQEESELGSQRRAGREKTAREQGQAMRFLTSALLAQPSSQPLSSHS